ncbi:MAG: hypothetical protein Q8Q52_01625 [Acidimicrobiia bacterium]|nr:hypothetical protein [Acidimicrobiia bacterium]
MDRTEFLAAIRSEGFERSGRKLTDWIERGLLASPDRSSDGHGVAADYTGNQLKLALDLLGKHRPGQDVDGLYNEPVAIWLFWHNQEIVPLEQAQRAWRSWAETRSRGGRSGIRGVRAASELADQFQAAGVPKDVRNDLARAFAAANTNGKLDLGEVRQSIGDDLLSRPQIRGMVRVLERKLAAIEHRDDLTDDDFYQARAEHLALMPPKYRQDNIEELVRSACYNLTTHLGDVYLSKT